MFRCSNFTKNNFAVVSGKILLLLFVFFFIFLEYQFFRSAGNAIQQIKKVSKKITIGISIIRNAEMMTPNFVLRAPIFESVRGLLGSHSEILDPPLWQGKVLNVITRMHILFQYYLIGLWTGEFVCFFMRSTI